MMLLFLAPLLLSGLAMAKVDQFLQDLKVAPLPEHLYIFDVKTDAQLSDVTAALNDVTIRHCLKVFGENRYIIALAGEAQALKELTFPAGSEVTQTPIEYLSDYFKVFNITTGFEHAYDNRQLFGDAIVTILYWELIFSEETTPEQYNALVQTMADRFLKFHKVAKPVTYAITSSYPPRFYTLVAVQDNAVQHVGKSSLSFLGGPGRVYSRLLNGVEV